MFFGNSGSDANDSLVKMLRYYFNAIGKPSPDDLLIAVRQGVDHLISQAERCGVLNPVLIVPFLNTPDGDIVRSRELITDKVLENNPDLLAECINAVFAQIVPIEKLSGELASTNRGLSVKTPGGVRQYGVPGG